jgi:hypothetical protein
VRRRGTRRHQPPEPRRTLGGAQRQVALPGYAEGRVVEAGLRAVRTAGEVVVLAEVAECAVARTGRVGVGDGEARLRAVLAAVARVASDADRRDGERADAGGREDEFLHVVSFRRARRPCRISLVGRESASASSPEPGSLTQVTRTPAAAGRRAPRGRAAGSS